MSDLGFWLALATLALLFWKQGARILQPVTGALLGLLGRFYGSYAMASTVDQVMNIMNESSAPVTASESEVTASNPVTAVTCSALEMAWIAYELGRGSTPSQTAKGLPGYSPSSYQEFAGKVGEVEALLAEMAAVQAERSAKRQARTQAKEQLKSSESATKWQ